MSGWSLEPLPSINSWTDIEIGYNGFSLFAIYLIDFNGVLSIFAIY
jgi:hypothetical protein